MSLLRRIVGIVGWAVIWGVAWGVAGATASVITALQASDRVVELGSVGAFGAVLAAGSVTIAQRVSRQAPQTH